MQQDNNTYNIFLHVNGTTQYIVLYTCQDINYIGINSNIYFMNKYIIK